MISQNKQLILRKHSPSTNQMDKSSFTLLWLMVALYICLINIGCAHGILLKFTNISCDAKNSKLSSVEYCFIQQVDRLKNYASVRYTLQQPIENDLILKFRFMVKTNGWQPFLYAVKLDLCRFWKSRYNAIAKMMAGFIDDHTNMNHSCPYNEMYFAVDKVMNTDISRKIPGIPLGKGHYALYTVWTWKNSTIGETKTYFEVVSV